MADDITILISCMLLLKSAFSQFCMLYLAVLISSFPCPLPGCLFVCLFVCLFEVVLRSMGENQPLFISWFWHSFKDTYCKTCHNHHKLSPVF